MVMFDLQCANIMYGTEKTLGNYIKRRNSCHKCHGVVIVKIDTSGLIQTHLSYKFDINRGFQPCGQDLVRSHTHSNNQLRRCW